MFCEAQLLSYIHFLLSLSLVFCGFTSAVQTSLRFLSYFCSVDCVQSNVHQKSKAPNGLSHAHRKIV